MFEDSGLEDCPILPASNQDLTQGSDSGSGTNSGSDSDSGSDCDSGSNSDSGSDCDSSDSKSGSEFETGSESESASLELNQLKGSPFSIWSMPMDGLWSCLGARAVLLACVAAKLPSLSEPTVTQVVPML